MATIREVVREHLETYLAASRKEKGSLLDRLEKTLPMSRKALIERFSRMRRRDPWKSPPKKRGRKEVYGPGVTAALQTVWAAAGEICGELLHPVIAEYADILRRDGMWKHRESDTCLLLAMSEGTVKKRVGAFQKARRRRGGFGTTKPSNLKEIVPVFTGPWEGKSPGYGQMDTVVHCGSSLVGDMVFTLQYADVSTYWSCRRAQWNKGEQATLESFSSIREKIPFPIRGTHADSGGEFLNWTMKKWCDREDIEFTRSRPYHKNDNAFVEERNGHVVRKYVGYGRLDVPETVCALNAFYEVLGLHQNHFIASRRCVRKERMGSKYIRRYEKAETPYARVLRHPLISEEVKERLREEHTRLNPLKLKRELDILRRLVFEIQKQGAEHRKEILSAR